MAFVVRYVCHHCGAARQGATGSGWVRCQHCDALIAFDWQAWLESKEYAAFLKQAALPATQAEWGVYQALVGKAEAAAKGGDERGATALYRQAMEKMAALNPSIFPAEVQTKPAYREKWLAQAAWVQWQQAVDPVASKLQADLLAMLKKLDYRAPMPTIEKALENLLAQYQRFEALGLPEDPDGMPPAQRRQAALSQFVGGYLQLVPKAQQRGLLECIYGKQNVVEAGASTDDALGLFRKWRCPACGLMTLQGRSVGEFTCIGCGFRKPVGAQDQALERVELPCGRCGAKLALEANEIERACAFCGTWNRRQVRTGDVERQFARDVMADLSKQHGFALTELPAEGKPGLPVTPQNRAQVQAAGLMRLANGYGTFLDARGFIALVASTTGAVDPAGLTRALTSVRGTAAQESGQPAALALIDEALKLVGGAA